MRPLRAALLGVVAGGVLAYVAAATVALALTVGDAQTTVAAGPLLLLAVERTTDGTSTTFGVGLMAIAAVCGLLNAVLAWALGRHIR
jgi:hypothetical protein